MPASACAFGAMSMIKKTAKNERPPLADASATILKSLFKNSSSLSENTPPRKKWVSMGTVLKNRFNYKKNRPKLSFDDFGLFFSGGPEEIRTPHLSNANAALYQMSYRPMCLF